MAQQHAGLSSQATHGQGTNTYLVSSPVTSFWRTPASKRPRLLLRRSCRLLTVPQLAGEGRSSVWDMTTSALRCEPSDRCTLHPDVFLVSSPDLSPTSVVRTARVP
jgi:hypothetical protein